MNGATPATGRGSEPKALIERVLSPFERFAARESSGGMVLLACTIAAIVWANTPWHERYFSLWEGELAVGVGTWEARTTLHHFINDGLMAVFFFLVGLEIKREILVGELSSWRKATLPLAGALGGMLVPALIYALLNGGSESARGWGIPTATDIAFALGVLTLLGNRVHITLKVFLVALAIADDIGAVLVIAIFYSSGIGWTALALAGTLLALSLASNAAGVRSPIAYAMIGLAVWAAMLASGVHATVAGVLLAFTIPSRTRIDEAQFLARGRDALRRFDDALDSATPGLSTVMLSNSSSQEAVHALERLAEAAQPPLHRLERALHTVVALGIMPLFAFANAGVRLGGGIPEAVQSPVSLGILLGLVVGKPIGITLASWLAVRAGIAVKPDGVSWRELHYVTWLGGIGFTMSLFIANLAFTGPGAPTGAAALLDAAKIGVLAASITAGVVGYLLVRYGPLPAREESSDSLVDDVAQPPGMTSVSSRSP